MAIWLFGLSLNKYFMYKNKLAYKNVFLLRTIVFYRKYFYFTIVEFTLFFDRYYGSFICFVFNEET